MANARSIKNAFNDLAESLGCNARIGGTKKAIKFFEFRGGFSNGFEVWFPIDATRFGQLINPYPQLQD